MAFEFRFRKFLGYDVVASGYSIPTSAIPAPFNDTYTAYNTVTDNGNLLQNWSSTNNAIVLSVTDSNPTFKDVMQRDWIEEDGIDVYIPSAMKHKPTSVDIELMTYGADATSLANYNQIKNKIATWGVFEYYDNYHKALKRLKCDSIEIIMNMQRGGSRVIHFKLKCTNVLGYDILNFNPSAGGLF